MTHHLLLIIHLLAASVWVGGHLILLIRYLPKALKNKDVEIIKNFEKQYEPIGLPALLILVGTGVLMAYQYNVTLTSWFSFESNIERVISIKLCLLMLTLVLAIHARLFIIPKLTSKTIILMAVHILLITLIGVSMLIVGSFVRFGGL
ncbi:MULTISPECIES: CopD family protein [Flavobacterium]|uniref:Copper resistance protein CopD n=1 Tax=Flavobacterium columnare TaxID=996 RepID=A0AA94JQF8_9FLAO|nr:MULTISPECIES: CopD family protein [Flavobacterium]AMA49658.1 copper resistance protein CopD [Flavobacterium covae]AND63347.1 copper resistance protein CopD [Flavobacterium covae]MCH4828364.1 CopD family protein [Flavobacterium columnare]MCH4832192.1 CopD family protein [Flavobacterium columnare]MCJ1805792.1 CopD family protein [Flavobacterium covae]